MSHYNVYLFSPLPLPLAFVCHHSTYLIYASLRKRSLTQFTYVSHISVLTSFVFCLVLGLAGFVTFMDQTQGEGRLTVVSPRAYNLY